MNEKQEQRLRQLKQEIKEMKQMMKDLQSQFEAVKAQCELEIDNILSQIEEALIDE